MKGDDVPLADEEDDGYACPSLSTFLLYTSIVVVAGAVIIPLEFNFGLLKIWRTLDEKFLEESSVTHFVMQKLGYLNSVGTQKEQVFIKEELKKFTGDSAVLYLAILGRVYDVTKGRRHYGKDGGYSFFTGIDGTRAFVTGEFNKEGLIDNIENLKPRDYLALYDWLEMYEKDYSYVGKLKGFFYDQDGNPGEGLQVLKEGMEKGKIEKAYDEEDSVMFPECNSKWTPESGAEVWCAKKSGGITREWIGYPRQYFKVGQTNYRCACVNNNYLSDPRFKEYTDCPSTSRSCKFET